MTIMRKTAMKEAALFSKEKELILEEIDRNSKTDLF